MSTFRSRSRASKADCRPGIAFAFLLTSALSSPAFAQQTQTSDSAESATPLADRRATSPTTAAAGDIIVTATRRDTLLEKTPIAESAFSAKSIEEQRLYTITDVAQRTPGLVFTPFSRQESYPSIRGTTVNNDAPGSNLGVSVFIDDVPTTGVGDNNPDLFDLQSIEVLRGPQGTLFGRNVTGGAIVVRSLEPSFDTQVRVQGSYGSQNLVEGRGYVTGPLISDRLAGKIAFEARRQDGILNNVFLNNKTLSTSLYGVRGQLLWTPTSNFRVLFGADFTHDTSPYKVQQLLGNFQPSLFPPMSFKPNDTNQGSNSQGNSKVGGGLVRAELTAPWGSITSITGLRLVDERDSFSTSAEPYNELLQHRVELDQQVTQEVRFASNADQRLTWQFGVFLLHAHREQRKHYDLNVKKGVLVSYVPPYSALVFGDDQNQSIIDNSFAGFGELTYAITPKLKFTLGARYTLEDKNGRSSVVDTSGLSDPLIAPYYSHSWGAFTPKAQLSFQVSDNLLLYATASSGFKSGGYDLSATSSAGLATPFKPEHVKSYEAGMKLTAFDKRLTINAAGYYADYTDLQVQEFNATLLQFVTSNAGVSHIPGGELEVSATPVDWLTLNGSYTYMDAKYTRYNTGQDDFSGNQIPFDAKSHLNVGGEIHAPIGGGTVRMGGDVTYQSKRYFLDANDDPAFITSHTSIKGLINVHASWTSANGALEVLVWGKNITNRRYLNFASDLTPFFASFAEYRSPIGNKMFDVGWNMRPQVGVTLTFHH